MPFAALLLLLGLVGTVSSRAVCPPECNLTEKHEPQYFKHVSDLGDSSVAPWTLTRRDEHDEQLGSIKHAECQTCNVVNMTAKPIYFQITVFRRVVAGGHWCRCPYELSVGCTCVKKE